MKIIENYSLLNDNTFKINVNAKYFVEIEKIDDYRAIRESSFYNKNELMILGGGSNVLFTKDINALVLKMKLKGIKIIEENEQHALVNVAAGEVWHDFVLWCIDHNLGGVENLSLIPGYVGASPMQNIGAYGVEVKDSCTQVNGVNILSGDNVQYSNHECLFGYRESIFKHELKSKVLITDVTFKLNKQHHFNIEYGDIKRTLEEMNVSSLSIRSISDAVIKIRKSKLPDPEILGNAGSFFKNPTVTNEQADTLKLSYPSMPQYPQAVGTKIPAGWLIEQCGWKGKRIGNTGSHQFQALVLVNYGNANGNEIYQLALDIQQSVLEKFGITISPEVNIF